jgi:hypothetical protein
MKSAQMSLFLFTCRLLNDFCFEHHFIYISRSWLFRTFFLCGSSFTKYFTCLAFHIIFFDGLNCVSSLIFVTQSSFTFFCARVELASKCRTYQCRANVKFDFKRSPIVSSGSEVSFSSGKLAQHKNLSKALERIKLQRRKTKIAVSIHQI